MIEQLVIIGVVALALVIGFLAKSMMLGLIGGYLLIAVVAVETGDQTVIAMFLLGTIAVTAMGASFLKEILTGGQGP